MSDVKLYRVTIECDVWVIARSERDAEAIISTERDVLSEVRDNADVRAVVVTEAQGDSLPWRADNTSDEDDMTVTEWARCTRRVVAREKHEAKMAAAQTTIPGVTL